MEPKNRMKELTALLGEAARAYYAEDREIMSNLEYDRLYDELTALEKETGVIMAGSPTMTVGYEAVEELPKETHESPMLSLAKTKEREELKSWLGKKEGLLSWKLDGLTVVLTYEEGRLTKAVTRGNGEVGEVVTNNAKVFANLPLVIPFKSNLVLRGEAVITYDDFEKINEGIGEEGEKYKNPRNLCSGSVRQLNNKITAARNVRFYGFQLVKAKGKEFSYREEELSFLKEQGFELVEYYKVNENTVEDTVGIFEEKIQQFSIPSDGLVLIFDDIVYGKSLGRTAKFPRDAIAFKWKDESRETKLQEVEWSPSRTGLINPVAIFEPVELEGTTVSRASVHNLSIMKNLRLGYGDVIRVYKANMIIPQIAENLTCSDTVKIPSSCPACGGITEIRKVNEVESLYCTNPLCSAKIIKAFTLFVGRDAMNIEGLSEATLQKFIDKGFLKDYTDIFHLDKYQQEIQNMEGFGIKSYTNLMESIEKAREVSLAKVIYSLGISNIGLANAKMICKHFKNDIDALLSANKEELNDIDGVGEVIAEAFVEYFRDEKRREIFLALLKELKIQKEDVQKEQILEGKAFAVTGSLAAFENRNQLKEKIEFLGGKVTSSVTSKTFALINNDAASNSSKNKKARELGVKILTEQDFIRLYLREE